MRIVRRTTLLLSIVVLSLSPAATWAEDYLTEFRTIAAPPQSTTEHFQFTRGKDDRYPYLELTVKLTQGRAGLTILDPSGKRLEAIEAQECALALHPIPGATAVGEYTVALTTTDAVGTWDLRVAGGPTPKPPLGPGLTSAIAMLVVAIASLWIWRRSTDESWRWAWIGAGLWTVAVAAKFALAIPLNGPVLGWLKASLPYWGYLTAGMIYGGALTGITEVLFVYVAARIWPRMTKTPQRAAGVGVGAGAFEAALLALAAGIAAFAGAGVTTWLVAFVPSVERVIAILGHVASRLLAIMAVTSRRWVFFLYGFLLLSGVDAVAMYLHLSGKVQTMSPWLMEVMLLPFAIVSIPIIRWCTRHWPVGG